MDSGVSALRTQIQYRSRRNSIPPLACSLLRLSGALSGMVSAASSGRCGHGATHLSPTHFMAPYALSEGGNTRVQIKQDQPAWKSVFDKSFFTMSESLDDI
jgi:hypothetical protein